MEKTKINKAKRVLSLALCFVMLFGLMTPAAGASSDGLSLIGMLFGVTEAYAAENDVTTWTACGTCEWGIDPDGCLWIRPINGVSGTLANWGYSTPPWYSQRANVTSVIVKSGVSAATCLYMFANATECTSIDLSGLDISSVSVK